MFFARLCDVFLLCYNYVIYLFDVVTFFDNVRITLYFGTFELRSEKTLELRYVFSHYCDVILLRHNYVIFLFDVVTLFDNVRITLYFGTFELRMEITLQIRFIFARHCDVFFITSQSICLLQLHFMMTLELRYILGR